MKLPKFKTGVTLILLVGIGVPVPGSIVSAFTIPEWGGPHLPSHAVIEGAGASIAWV
jgi:hypothetical protein